MKKIFLSLAFITFLLFVSCSNPKQNNSSNQDIYKELVNQSTEKQNCNCPSDSSENKNMAFAKLFDALEFIKKKLDGYILNHQELTTKSIIKEQSQRNNLMHYVKSQTLILFFQIED